MLIPTPSNTKTVSDMRQDPIGLLKSVEKSQGPNYIFYRSTPKAVILNIKEYQELLEALEDYQDSLIAQQYEKEDKTKIKWLTAKEMRRQLGLSNKQ